MAARIQVQREARRGEIVEVRVLIQHPMETGFRYDAFGRQTPRNVIYSFECRYGGIEVFRAADGRGHRRQPLPEILLAGQGLGRYRVPLGRSGKRVGTVSARVNVNG